MSTRRKIAGALTLSGLMLLGHAYGCTTYKFGIPQQDYSQYFPAGGSSRNRVYKFSPSHSWLTALPLDQGFINVEHLTLASEEDAQRLGLPEGRYLFFSLAMASFSPPGVTVPLITAVSVTHAYGGEPLELVGSYVFGSHLLNDGTPDPTRHSWKIRKLDGPTVALGRDGFVQVYRVPPTALVSRLVPPAFWFNKALAETITVEFSVGGEPRSTRFEFISEWHQSSSVMWVLLNST